MVNDFNKHLGEMLKKRRLALGLTQTKVAKAINVTFQQIQKYEKGINGVSFSKIITAGKLFKSTNKLFF
jgi:transcriptional regulator with XRE-family HTH domain